MFVFEKAETHLEETLAICEGGHSMYRLHVCSSDTGGDLVFFDVPTGAYGGYNPASCHRI